VTPRALVLPALTLLALIPAPRAGSAAPVPTMPPGALHRGQKAIVRTVFEGTRIEEFEAEVVGVLSSGRAAGDMIVARATSPRVIATGVAQGMSGSPVYVDGKLVGALSSGWAFTKEPLFGITPIGEMLDVLALPETRGAAGTSGPGGLELAPAAARPRFRELHWDDGDEIATPGSDDVTGVATPTPLALPLAATGLHPDAVDAARRAFAPFHLAVTPGGRSASGGPPADSLAPGSAVAVDLLRGDLQLSAIGTITWRDGDRVLLFGHPFFQAGEVRLPLSTAEITTVVGSQANSFKLGVSGRPAGVATQDRRAAVAGVIGRTTDLLPIALTVSGPDRPTQRMRFESIDDRALAPTLISIASFNGVLERGGTAGGTLRWSMTLHRRGVAPLVMHDVVSSDAPTGEFVNAIASPLRFLFGNPFERLVLDSVVITAETEPARRLWTLRTARLVDGLVRPGGEVRVRCELEAWHGGRERRELTLQIPAEAPPGRYVLWVGGGPELTRYESQRLPGRFRPVSLDDAWSRLSHSRSSDGLHGALFARAPEVSADGRDYPELPLSALAMLAGGESAGDHARRGDTAWLASVREPVDGVLRGSLLLQVQVDGQAP
jgi:SpoIVB peptidase S55